MQQGGNHDRPRMVYLRVLLQGGQEMNGLKFDDGKPMMRLIPPKAEIEMAKVLTFGAAKYGVGNWQHVEGGATRYLDAMMRHINSYRQGEQIDAESGLNHLAHAMCCAAFLLEMDPRD